MSECKLKEQKISANKQDEEGENSGISEFSSSFSSEDEQQKNEVEREWNLLKHKVSEGDIRISNNNRALEVVEGFRIEKMNMKDGTTGIELWSVKKQAFEGFFENEIQAYVPKAILNCSTVVREMIFSSTSQIEDFKLEQKVFFKGHCIENWRFRFGFVIPGSINNWEQVIEAAQRDRSFKNSAASMSGKVTIETSFYDGVLFLCKTRVRIFYV